MDRPNILIFMTDHQRADTLLPEHPAVTPNMDAFLREGLLFPRAYCPSPHCCPSRATFMSGLYPSGHGVWNNVCNAQALARGLKEGVRLWSEDLCDAGYRMYYGGKWHVSAEESPRDRGWEELPTVSARGGEVHGQTWAQIREAAARPLPAERGPGEILRPGYPPYTLYGEGEGHFVRHDDRIVEESVARLPDIAAGEGPWCLYVGATGPHDPYVVPKRYLDLYDPAEVPLPPSYHDEMHGKPAICRRVRREVWGQLTEAEVCDAIRHFWAFCSYLDDRFGQILSALEATGQAENTLVLFTADHGDYCGDHGLFCKGIPCYDGAYRVPAAVRWPAGLAAPGRREEAFVSLADFAPTVLELAGVSPERRFTGASLAPFLRNERPDGWRDAVFTQCNGVELYYTQRSVRTDDWKYVWNGFDEDELYDLRADPHEMTNRAADPALDAVKRDLCRRLWRFAEAEGDPPPSSYITVGVGTYGPEQAFRD